MAIVIDLAQARRRAMRARIAERYADERDRARIEALGRLVVDAGPSLSVNELLQLLSLVRAWRLNR